MVIPYLIMFVIGITGSSIFFPNCEISLLALTSLDIVKPFNFLGYEINLSAYCASIPLILALSGALGSTIGSSMYYFIGRGTLRVSKKLKEKLVRFDLERFEKSSVAITFTSSAFSLPPFTILSLAAGMTRFSLWQYIPVSFVGKATRFTIVVYTGDSLIRYFRNLIG